MLRYIFEIFLIHKDRKLLRFIFEIFLIHNVSLYSWTLSDSTRPLIQFSLTCCTRSNLTKKTCETSLFLKILQSTAVCHIWQTKKLYPFAVSIFGGKFRVPSQFLWANFSKSVPYLSFCSKSGKNRGGTSVFVVQVHFYVVFFSELFSCGT